MYDSSAGFWAALIAQIVPIKSQVLNTILWAYHQRFFASLCMSAKVEALTTMARSALDAGHCVVIGLQSTGESVAGAESVADDDDLASTADGIARSLLLKHCVQRGMKVRARDKLLGLLERLSPTLPANPLDDIIDRLGGPSKVAEMTGRRHRYVRAPDGAFRYVPRTREGSTAQSVNIMERQHFQANLHSAHER
jgi:hypothetical protein